MSGSDAIKVEGRIVDVLSERTYRIELSNGHRLLGFVPGKKRAGMAPLVPGQMVRLQLSPCDLSQGRIVVEN